MARTRIFALPAVFLLALGSVSVAGEALDRIERILMVAQDFDHGMPASADPTAEVNALLEMPKDEVVAALKAALLLGRQEGSMAQTFVPLVVDLGRLLTDTPRGPRDREEPLLFEVEGAVLMRGDRRRNTPFLCEVPDLATVVGKSPKLRALLPRGRTGLLDLVLADPDRFDLEDVALRDSLAAAIATAAAKDVDLLGRLIEAVRQTDPAAPVSVVLAHALAGPLSFPGERALMDLLERAAARDPSSVGEFARALRNGGRSSIVDAVRDQFAESGDVAALEAFDQAAGPWFAVRRILAGMPEDPEESGAEDLRRLARVSREIGPISDPEDFSTILWKAYTDERTLPKKALVAGEFLSRLIWPRWSGRTEAFVALAGSVPASYSVTGLGGVPATTDLLEYNMEIAEDRPLRWAPKPFDPVAWSPLAARRGYVVADQPSEGVRLSARLTPATIRIEVQNTGEDPLLLHPSAFGHAGVRSVVVTTAEGASTELWLSAGALGRGLSPIFHDEDHLVLDSGATRTVTVLLPGPVPEGTKVFVDLFDPAEPHPEYGPPPDIRRLRSFRGIRAVPDIDPPSEADRRARALLDRIVFFDENNDPGLDFTRAVNELLSLGPETVGRAFRAALDHGSCEGTPAGDMWTEVLSLVTAIQDVPPHRTGAPWESDWGFRSLAGFVVFVPDQGGFYSGPVPEFLHPPGLPDIGGEFPERLKPDPAAFLARCRSPDKTVKRWLEAWEFPKFAGRALGDFARGDAEWSKKILAELLRARLSSVQERDPVGLILAHAAARIGGDEVKAVLRKRALDLIPRKGTNGGWGNLWGIVEALREAGDEEFLRAWARELDPMLVGDLLIVDLLGEAEKKPTAALLNELDDALRWSIHATVPPEVLLRALDLALKFADSKDRALGPAARELVLAVVWPHNQYPVKSSWSTAWSPEFGGRPAKSVAVVEEGRGEGGWPDPVAGARWLREQIREGVIRIARTSPVKRSLFSSPTGNRIDGRPVGEVVEFTPTRDGDRLRIVLTNRASGPVCVNPLAFRLATSEVVEVREDRDGEITNFPKVKLFLGWGHGWHEAVISTDRLRVLKPGETAEFTFALGEWLPPTTRITVRFSDPFVVDGPLPCPRLEALETVRVK